MGIQGDNESVQLVKCVESTFLFGDRVCPRVCHISCKESVAQAKFGSVQVGVNGAT